MNHKLKVGLFGGAFDHPHIGHIIVINNLLIQNNLDEVWVVPSGIHRDKSLISDAKHRLDMLQLLFADFFNNQKKVQLKDFQIKDTSKISTSIDLWDNVNELFPSYEFYFVIGSDLVDSLDSWYQGEELLKKSRFIIFNRPGYTPKRKKKKNTLYLNNKWNIESDISSRCIRDLIKNSQPIHGLVPPSVEKYIYENNLYQG